MRLLFVPDSPHCKPPPPEVLEAIDHPSHYNSNPSGVECIVVAEHMNFCLGNALKYIWRAGFKNDAIEDLKKARWYLDREIQRLEQQPKKEKSNE